LFGQQGEILSTSISEENNEEGIKAYQLALTNPGLEGVVELYLDALNNEQPKAPLGSISGSPYEYSRAISIALFQ